MSSNAEYENDLIEDAFIDDEESSQADKYLLFNIASEVYGINIAHVTEIIEMQKVTIVPDVPVFVKGVINLRGRVIPVMDLRLRFGMPERAYDDRTCIIITNIGSTAIGFIVDTVAEVHSIRDEAIDTTPSYTSDDGRNGYICGLGKIGDSITILIDVQHLISERQMTDLEPVAASVDQ